jgi:hypothetical protein
MIVRFRSKAEERDIREFKERCSEFYLPRLKYHQALLNHYSRYTGSRLPLETLEQIQRESFEALDLLWWGLPPEEQEELVEWLAPWWAEIKALRARNRALAERALAQAGER